MKGLNVKKLAAIAVGSALVGSALVPMVAAGVMNNADQISKSDLVSSSTGAPLVQVVVGTNGAAVSDFIWAGNIAAKVAQLATTDKQVVIGGGGSSDPTVSGKTVDVTVGGTVSYSSESSFTFQDSNYPLKSGSGQGNHEFVKALTDGQLPFLTNATKNYTYNGSSYSVVMKEQIVLDADAKFDKASGVKDLSAVVAEGGLKYVLEFGDGTKNGIPATALTTNTASSTAFDDGDNDNIVIPFLGEMYTVNQIDKTSSPASARMIKESAKTTYYEGNEITGLKGKGAYEGQELKVKIAAVTTSGPAASTYSARAELYDTEGNLVDTQTVSAGNFLDQMFLSGGSYVLDTLIYIPTISVETSTNKGYVTATVGKGVVRLYDSAQYPYDSSDTNTQNDYWKAQLDFNSTATTTPGYIDTLQRITIKNAVKVWDNIGANTPIYAKEQALVDSHNTEAMQEAVFLSGIGLGEETLGYNFVRLKFDGFKQDKTTLVQVIGKPTSCVATGVGGSSGCVIYKDSGNIERIIPMYYELGLNTGTTWSSFNISNATFWYRCSSTNVSAILGLDNNALNGGILAATIDFNQSDFGKPLLADMIGDTYVAQDINGVTYVVAGNLDASATYTLTADGNCQFSSTDPNTTPTYIGMGTATPMNNTIFYSDTNGARIGKASYPLQFSGTSISDTYNYAYTANESTGRIYLLLDGSTSFTTPYSNIDLNLLGTDKAELGAVLGAVRAVDGSSNFRKYYLPDIEGTGGNAGDNTFYTAQFAVDANGGVADLYVNIDAGTGKPLALPNNNLSIWNSDVNALPNQSAALWTLSTSTASGTELTSAYLDNGTKVVLDSDKVTVTSPETQTYLKFTVLGKAATSEVEGGEALTGLAEGEKGKTTGGTEVTVTSINVDATCPAGGGATATPSTYKSVYPIGEMVVADTVKPAKAIIVGGYLVNRMAADVVLSDGTNLTEALTASGDMVVDVLNSGDIVVAGYTADDTKQAAKALIDSLDALLG